jgi:hypothetical protein
MIKIDLYLVFHPKNGYVTSGPDLEHLMRIVKKDYFANEVTVMKMVIDGGVVKDSGLVPLSAYEFL